MKKYFYNLARFCLVLVLMSISGQVFSQKAITGVVTEGGGSNEMLIGATVQVKGKTVSGTITDINGKYKITANSTDVLVFSYVGMEKQEVEVKGRTEINVSLKANSQQLEEVVAIGYGVVKKSDLTGSVAVVSTKELTRNPAASAAQALQGKATGVLVTQTGQPGAGATIRVRGVGSINNSSDPIYILDGVRVNDINGLQPQDIENFQVLKDASATAIYGANGSNGVIIVNTKRGKSGKPVVNLNSYMTLNLAPKQYDVMNADEYSAFYTELTGAKAEYQQPFREKYYGNGWNEGTNWQSLLFKNGVSQNHNLSVSGGGENSNFNVSFAYNKEDGTVLKSGAESYNIRANSDFKLNKHIKIGENLSARYGIIQTPTSIESSVWDLTVSPLMKVYNSAYKGGFESCQTVYWEDAAGNLQQGTIPAGATSYTNTPGNDKANPLCSVLLGDDRKYSMATNASVYVQIDFTDWLMFKTTPAIGVLYDRSKYWMPKFEGNRATGSARLSETYSELISLNIENQLLFKKSFDKTHNVQATLVQQMQQQLNNTIGGAETGFDFEQLNTLFNGGSSSMNLTGGFTDLRTSSYLGRLIYDYKSKYFLTASTRRDGVSSFSKKNRTDFFTAASVAWKVNEDFFQDVKEIDALKLRVGWGQTGNSNTKGDYYAYYDKITASNNFSPVLGDDQHIASAQYVFYGMGSSDYHWETSEMKNFGIDLNMYNSRLQASAEYYIKDVNDLLIELPISDTFGRIGSPWVNLGAIQNRGVELSAQWRDRINDFGYGITSNFTTVKNNVKSLVSNITIYNNRTIVGHSIGALYGYVSEGIIQSGDDYANFPKQYGVTPQPGDLKYADLNGDGEIDTKDRTIIGKTIPSFNYSLGFDCSYKNFDLNVFLYGVGDYDIYNQQRATLSSMNYQDMNHNKLKSWAENHWTAQNASTTYVRLDAANTNRNDLISTFWIEDGSFLRIKDVQVGYNLPAKICKQAGIGNIRIYANASNLYCFTAYKGRDPESFMSTSPLVSGTDNGGYTVPRSFTFGLQVGF